MFFENEKYLFYDGAMGTMLVRRGLKPGVRPDLMNITAPEAVLAVQKMYVEAGSDIICTNTFGCNADALKDTGYTPEQVIDIAVAIAKQASSGKAKIALDIGPTGQLLEPMGDLTTDRAYELFAQQAIAGAAEGADFAAIETMSDINELKAAVLAVTENTALPVLATMTFDKSGYTFMGCTPEIFAKEAGECGAAAVGINCSLEPNRMYETFERLAKSTNLPLIVKLNAGLPDSVTGDYDTGAVEFARQMIPYARAGAKLLGGCCGTSPEYIRKLKKAVLEMSK